MTGLNCISLLGLLVLFFSTIYIFVKINLSYVIALPFSTILPFMNLKQAKLRSLPFVKARVTAHSAHS